MLFDTQLAFDIQQIMTASPIVLSLAVFLARYLIFFFLLFGVYLFLSGKPAWKHAVWEGGWAVILTLVITAIIAYFIQRARPFLGNLDPSHPIALLIPRPLNTSFPSGHTGTSFAMAMAVFSVHRRLGTIAFLMAILVAFGRVAVGVHYPTDVLGGITVGLGSFALVRFFHVQLRKRT